MKGLLPDFGSAPSGTVLVAMQSDGMRPQAMKAGQALRAAGVQVDLVLEDKKMKWIFKHADRTNAPYVILFAPQEADQGLVRVKCMADGEQEDVPIDDLPAVMAAKMAVR